MAPAIGGPGAQLLEYIMITNIWNIIKEALGFIFNHDPDNPVYYVAVAYVISIVAFYLLLAILWRKNK